MPETRSEEHASVRTIPYIGNLGQLELRLAATPCLVVERLAIETDRLVKLLRKRERHRGKEHGRSLVSNQPVAIDHELVAPRFPAEDRVVLEYQAALRVPGLLGVHVSGGESAYAAS